MTRNYNIQPFSSRKSQRGFLLPLTLFVIVISATIAVLMSKQVTSVSTTFLLNTFSAQSTYAADTGAQLGNHVIFFSSIDRQSADNQCEIMSINQVFPVTGLDQCTLTVSCLCSYDTGASCNSMQVNNYNGVAGVSGSYYRISSTAQCGSNFFMGRDSRVLESKYP
ncbi:MAG: hypothetical protein ACRBCI_07820 [Cellvibrionaceae bacterium]